MTWKVEKWDVKSLDELDYVIDDLYEKQKKIIAVVPTGNHSFRIYYGDDRAERRAGR